MQNLKFIKLDKEKIYINIIIIVSFFLIFFWTYSFFNSQIIQIKSRTYDLLNKIKKVEILVKKLNNNKSNSYILNIDLLSFIQQISTENNIDNRITNLQTINSNNNTETVYVKFNSLNLTEILQIIKNIEIYDNLYIKKLLITKQPNNNLANIAIILTKT